MFNLSGRHLNKAEISLLSKGLKFVPTPTSVVRSRLKEELEVFGRRLRLKWFFRKEEVNDQPINKFRKKSKFNPKGKDAAIELYLSRLEEEILSIDTKLSYSNITKEERKALSDLRKDTSIIIKGADKGSGVIVWDREDYCKEANKQLGDTDVYENISGDVSGDLARRVISYLQKIKRRGDISKEVLEYFLVPEPRIGRFYLLPKIHKRLHNVPGRPVISNCGFYTENISTFLDYHLQPLAKNVKSYIKDTNHFLRKLNDLDELPEDFLFVTVDVVGLYPNIPHEDGLQALKEALEKRENKSVSTESLVELAECVLKNNVFEHDNTYFRQKRGTAIGTKMAPPYAILFMAALEEKILKNAEHKPFVWWRYIDDVFMIWQHGKEKLENFLSYINSIHPTIKFTAEYSDKQINFLDITVTLEGDQLITDLYVKPTDTHQYLHASSCHVFHSKRAIPYSQALRLNRICSNNRLFDKRCDQLEAWLMERGYSGRLVRQQILRARKFNRKDLLNKERQDCTSPDLIFNITYHPAFSKLKTVLSNIHILLAVNQEHQKVFPTPPIIGFRKGKSLKDLLVRAKLPQLQQEESLSTNCGGKKCQVCSYVKNTDTFSGKEGKMFNVKGGRLDCNSSYVIYLVTCKTCKLQYVGSTTTSFRVRFNNYKQAERYYNSGRQDKVLQKYFHSHFNEADHNGMGDWSYTLIDCAEDSLSLRRKESFWQYKLGTFAPEGLNTRDVTIDDGKVT